MTTVIFVHGTGGREKAYIKTFEQIKEKIHTKCGQDIAIEPCLWGDQVGAKFKAQGISIPNYEESQGGVELPLDEVKWQELDKNPFYEMWLLSFRPIDDDTPRRKSSDSPANILEKRVSGLLKNADLQNKLDALEIGSVFNDACDRIIKAPQFLRLKATASNDLDEDYDVIARAIVAVAFKVLYEEDYYPQLLIDVDLRDEAFKVIRNSLSHTTKGSPPWLTEPFKGLFAGFSTVALYSGAFVALGGNYAASRKRGSLMDTHFPFAGDILLYQARGKQIRDFIHKQIVNDYIKPPVILLAHSLGGVACVDLLIENNLQDTVECLITVGSQAPLFYEIDALQTLRYGESLPKTFPEKWLNIYDPSDFLSFVGSKLFENRCDGNLELIDAETKSGKPFPISHSSYWNNNQTWDHIKKSFAMTDDNFQQDPNKVHAWIVGIEDFHPDTGLMELDGACQDAISFAVWLLEKGVKPENIDLFLSPLTKNKAKVLRELEKWKLKQKPAGRDQIDGTINQLKKYDSLGNLLYFFWSGHGFITDFSEATRRLYYADTNSINDWNLNLNVLIKNLNTTTDFEQQIFFVDACASFPAKDMRERLENGESKLGPFKQGSYLNDQLAIFAAPLYAKVENEEGMGGYFSQALMEELKDAPLLPDKNILTNQLQKRLEDKQKPCYLWFKKGDDSIEIAPRSTSQSWENVPDISSFFGREKDIDSLKKWVVVDRCRSIGIVGMAGVGKSSLAATLGKGGIGKTDLALKLATTIQDQFEYVIWRSLINPPHIETLLLDMIKFLSNQKEIELPKSLDDKFDRLFKYLKDYRCLIILDNLDTVLKEGSSLGQYQNDYNKLLQRVSSTEHKSCLLFTARERPEVISRFLGKSKPSRLLKLGGLSYLDGRKILQERGDFDGSDDEWKELVNYFNGNPLALELVSDYISNPPFNGQISKFLTQPRKLFNSMRKDLLEWHFDRLSDEEKEVFIWLALNREPMSEEELEDDIVSPSVRNNVSQILSSLQRRSLLETSSDLYTLQPVIMEYMTERFLEDICKEILQKEISVNDIKLFNSHALIKALAKDYIRESQVKLILQPILDKLSHDLKGQKNLRTQLRKILEKVQEEFPRMPGYIGGNILNLLIHTEEPDLRGWDFSNLEIWQAYLQGVSLPEVNFSSSNLSKSFFTKIFGSVISLAFSPDGSILATGDINAEVNLWRVSDNQKLGTCQGHNSWVRSIAFSPDGQTIASSSEDKTIRIWDIREIDNSGIEGFKCITTLQDCGGRVWCIAFSPDGKTLVSGSEDGTARLWDVANSRCFRILSGHTSRVRSVAFSPDARLLASSSEDPIVRLWELQTGKSIKTLESDADKVWAVLFSPDSKCLACADNNQLIRLWDVETGQILETLRGHSNGVLSLAFSQNGKRLASGSRDRTARLWDVDTARCLQTFSSGHTSRITSVALSPDGKILASGSDDRTVRLWDTSTGGQTDIFQGYTNWVWSVAFDPNGTTFASGSDDRIVRLWDINTGQCRDLGGNAYVHSDRVWCVTFSPDGKLLASGSDDECIKLWNVNNCRYVKTLQGHTSRVTSVAFHPNGRLLASGSHDHEIRLWNVQTGECQRILERHPDRIWSIAFSPDGHLLASGSNDRLIRLWDVSSGECFKTLDAHLERTRTVVFDHTGQVLASCGDDGAVKIWDYRNGKCLLTLEGNGTIYSISFSPNNQKLVSCGSDNNLRLWDLQTGKCLGILQGHTSKIWTTNFHPNGQTLVSGSQDGTIKLWSSITGECLRTFRPDRPYERMNITNIRGLTEPEKTMLEALGAIEDKV